MDTDDQIKAILNPIMDVMAGADGGVAFAKLRHSFMRQVMESDGENAQDILKSFKVVARACQIMQGQIPTVEL
jgi:hypothetical protein